ncbi:MAG: lamin tail domain-containing protein [Phycisphaerales bacterium]|nr:MAG: lamin tail domain-containing protein [Phycisphaerales bacterium]
MKNLISTMAIFAVAGAAGADIRITEWMYNNTPEYVEFTNLGNTPIDMTGWSYDDDSRIPGAFDLSAFGIVRPGESVLITEGEAEAFRASWSLPASIKIIGEYTNNLGRNDEINLYNDAGDLIDRLTYGDQSFPGSIRTQNRGGVPLSFDAIGVNDVLQWGFADQVAGGGPIDLTEVYGAVGFFTNTLGQTGNPGYFFVPTPGAAALLALAGLATVRRRR